MKTTFIYSLIDSITLQVRYIGKANKLDKRFRAHINEAKKKRTYKEKWINSLLTQKTEPILEIIDEVSFDTWEFWERHYISLYKSWGFNLTNDPNCLGGESGPRLCGEDNPSKRPEVKEKIKAAKRLTDNTKSGMYNKKHSTQTKQLMSSAHQGKIHLLESCIQMSLSKANPVLQLTLEGDLVKEWHNMSAVAEGLRKYTNPISNCCKGKQNKAYGYKWEFKNKQ